MSPSLKSNHQITPKILTTKPNILFILSDQHTPDVLGCYGDPIVRTPNLDRLARAGVMFENAYTPSPICVPARMSLLTGNFPFRQQCWTNSDALASDIPTAAHALGSVGYFPTLIGRLHAIGPDQLHGFARREIGDHMTDWYGGRPYTMGVLDKAQRPFPESLINSGPGQTSYELLDREVTHRTLQVLDEIAASRRAGDTRPFSLNVGFILPHQPYVAQPDLFEYYLDKVEPPRLPRPNEPADSYLVWWRRQTGLDKVNAADEMRARAAYYAMVDTLDGMIGQILDQLETLGLAENTLIIYASDHGDQLGERGLWWKQTFYEQSVKVPLLMSWPGMLPAATRRDQIVNLVDLTATIVQAAGADPLPGIDGRSLLQLARDPDTEWNNKTFSEYCTDGMQAWSGGRVLQSRMIRTGPWKYNYYHGYPNQLFNLADDPQEMRNLADDPDYRDIAGELVAELLQDWQPDQIDALIRHRNQCKSVLKAWAGQVQPPDTYRWETRMEDNWLADK